MGEIVGAISSLCKLLNTVIRTLVRPEYFRLSKFNKLNLDETEQFWSILHKLCCFSSSGCCESNAVKCVTNYLTSQGRVIAYFLPPEATPRQLLLCFGWLLSNGILESIIDKIILDTPLSVELPIWPAESDESEAVLRPVENDPVTQFNFAMYLTGLIKHNLRAIANYRQERIHILTKLHKATAGVCGLTHLSAGDVNVLSNRELMQDFLSRCHHCLPVFEAYCKWQKKSSVFWQWMDSVLKEEACLDLNKPLSDKELNHLIEFSKLLENNVRKAARLEGEEIAEEKFESLFIGRMQLSESGKFLDNCIDMLDSKIEILTRVNERRKQEFKIKQSNNKNASEMEDKINLILKQLGFNLEQNIQPHIDINVNTSDIEELRKLSLDEQKGT